MRLILPWPDGLPRGGALKLTEERRATPEEHAAAQDIVGDSCHELWLVPVASYAAMLVRPRPDGVMERGGETDQHLCVQIIGARWVHATGRPATKWMWVAQGRIARV